MKQDLVLIPDMWLRKMQNNTLEKIICSAPIGGRKKLVSVNIERDPRVKPGRKLNGTLKEDIGQEHWEIYLKTLF